MAITGHDLLILEWCLLSFCLLLIIFRFTIRLHYSRKALSWGDIFVFIAWCVFAASCGMDIRLNQLDFFNTNIDPLSPTVGREIAAVESLKLFFVGNAIYLLGLYAVKFSVLCFYREIIPYTKRKTSIALWCITVYTVTGCIVTFLINVLSCLPVSRNWSTDGSETCNSGWTAVGAYATSWVFHLSTDLLIYFLPLTLLSTLRLSLRQKVGVGMTFGLGFLCLFFASAVIAASFLAPDFSTNWIMCAFEQVWAITVVCVPSFRALAFWSKERRRTTSYYYGSHSPSGSQKRGSKSRGISGLYASAGVLDTELETETVIRTGGEKGEAELKRIQEVDDEVAENAHRKENSDDRMETGRRIDSTPSKFSGGKEDIGTTS